MNIYNATNSVYHKKQGNGPLHVGLKKLFYQKAVMDGTFMLDNNMHAVISPIRVALLPLVTSIHHSHHPSSLHFTLSFQVQNLPFQQILPNTAFFFFSRTDSTDSLDNLLILLSISIFTF